MRGFAPDTRRIFRAHGDSMEPLTGEGDRFIVDVSRPPVSFSAPAELRLISANQIYAPYAVPTPDVQMVGKVVWVPRKT